VAVLAGLRARYGALQLHAATTAARAGREGDAWRYWEPRRKPVTTGKTVTACPAGTIWPPIQPA
jgi:hypothetical protein